MWPKNGQLGGMRTLSLLAATAVLALTMTAPASAVPVGGSTFSGNVVHVSTQNIKVYDPKNHESLSFIIVPRFDQVFSADGNTTYQMKHVKPGMYVKVYYDQKGMGMRHADRILILNQANRVKGKQ